MISRSSETGTQKGKGKEETVQKRGDGEMWVKEHVGRTELQVHLLFT